MHVLIACEMSGVTRRAFRAAGHNAWSCDLLTCEDEDSSHHIVGDVRDLLNENWDLMIAHPDCTYLCSSGLHWNKRVPGRAAATEEALEFVRLLMNADIPRIAIENPVGCIGTRIRPADQYIQPYEYGHDASKKTGLWLKNLPLLVPDPKLYVKPRVTAAGNARWGNQTDSGQNKLSPGPGRWKERARTYEGWANAFAAQWGRL